MNCRCILLLTLLYTCVTSGSAARVKTSELDEQEAKRNPHAIMPRVFGQNDEGTKILTLGDSITAGWSNGGHPPFFPYGRDLQEGLGDDFQVVVDGISGSLAQQWKDNPWAGSHGIAEIVVEGALARGPGVRTILSRYDFKLAIIMLGTNDFGHFHNATTILSDVIAVHSFCHKHHVPTVALTIPPAQSSPESPERKQVNKYLEGWCSKAPLCKAFIRSKMYLGAGWDSDEEARNKGLHFRIDQYQSLGRNLAKDVRALFSSRPRPQARPVESQPPLVAQPVESQPPLVRRVVSQPPPAVHRVVNQHQQAQQVISQHSAVPQPFARHPPRVVHLGGDRWFA